MLNFLSYFVISLGIVTANLNAANLTIKNSGFTINSLSTPCYLVGIREEVVIAWNNPYPKTFNSIVAASVMLPLQNETRTFPWPQGDYDSLEIHCNEAFVPVFSRSSSDGVEKLEDGPWKKGGLKVTKGQTLEIEIKTEDAIICEQNTHVSHCIFSNYKNFTGYKLGWDKALFE